MERFTDEELIERCQAAEEPAAGEAFLNVLFQRHHARVASWCYHITGDTNTAVDLAQDVFIKVFQGVRSFQRGSKFTTWLYSITRNHCLDELRSRKRQVEEQSAEPDEINDWAAISADSAIEQRESRDLMRRLIRDSLDETEAKVMILHYIHELPLGAVSQMLGLTNESGAKAYIVSARRKLKRAHEMWMNRNKAVRAARHAE
jgi:RNA polymerase sigma-70 factor (ECF subfamily)